MALVSSSPPLLSGSVRLPDMSLLLFSSMITADASAADALLVPGAPPQVCLLRWAVCSANGYNCIKQYQAVLTFKRFNTWNMHLAVVLSVHRSLSSSAACQGVPQKILGIACFSKLKVAFHALTDGAGGSLNTWVDSDGFPFKSAQCALLIGGQGQDRNFSVFNLMSESHLQITGRRELWICAVSCLSFFSSGDYSESELGALHGAA